MIILWILICIIAFIVIILHFSISVNIKADKNGVQLKVRYLFLNIYPREKKEKKKTNEKNNDKEDYDFYLEDLEDDFIVSDDEMTDEAKAENSHLNSDEKILIDDEKVLFDNSNKEFTDNETDNKIKRHTEIKKNKKKKEKNKKESKFASLKNKYQKIKPYIPTGWKAVKKLCKTVRFEDIDINAEIGRFDAHEAVIYYGILQSDIFLILGWIANIFTLKMKKTNVQCIFGENIINGNIDVTVRVRPSAVIAIAFCTAVNFGVKFLINKIRIKRKSTVEV